MTTSKRRTTLFLGVPMDIDTYDDETALTAYVWRHCLHLLTPLEKRVGHYSVPIVSDNPTEKGRRLHQMLEERDGHVPDGDVWNARKLDMRDFRKSAMQRLITDNPDGLTINRCISCQRLTRTPVARQCTWCGTTWRT